MSTILKIVPELKNLILNGNFDFWQRGTSVNLTTSNLYQADRFLAAKTATFTGTSTYARSTDVPTFAQSGFSSTYSTLITNGNAVAGGAGDVYYLGYHIEGYDYALLHSRSARFQFWVKSSVTGTYSIAFRNSANDRSYIANYTINAVNTWERKTIDITMDTTGTWLFDSGLGLRIYWTLNAGSTFRTATTDAWQAGNHYASSSVTNTWTNNAAATFQIAQVALYPIQASSSIILPFSRAGRSIQSEFAMCQRYYEVGAFEGQAVAVVNGVSARGRYSWKVNKRVAPTVTIPAVTNYQPSGAASNTASTTGDIEGISFAVTGTITGQASGFSAVVSVASGQIIADAEL